MSNGLLWAVSKLHLLSVITVLSINTVSCLRCTLQWHFFDQRTSCTLHPSYRRKENMKINIGRLWFGQASVSISITISRIMFMYNGEWVRVLISEINASLFRRNYYCWLFIIWLPTHEIDAWVKCIKHFDTHFYHKHTHTEWERERKGKMRTRAFMKGCRGWTDCGSNLSFVCDSRP